MSADSVRCATAVLALVLYDKPSADSDKMAIIPTTRKIYKGTSRSNTYNAYTKVSLD
jgi:hypothetical protein